MNRHLARSAVGLGLITLLAMGCGESKPALLPVEGKVLINGKPAIEGGVTFRNVANQTMQLVGAIKPDGTYAMMRNRDQGAPAGEYIVTVLVTETPKGPDGNYSGLPKTISNQKFSNPATSPLKVEVKADAAPGAYDLEVTS